MNIEFAPGAAGFREARHLSRIVGYYRESLHASGDIAQLMGTLENVADKHMEKNEFRVLRESLPDDRDLARASTPPDNARVATVLFKNVEPLQWLHVHETWLPSAVASAGSYDF